MLPTLAVTFRNLRQLSRCFATGVGTSSINYHIHKYNNQLSLEKSIFSDIDVELDDIEFCLPDKNIKANLTWLRDSCHCKSCTHQSSKQRLFTPKDFRKENFLVKDVHLSYGSREGEPHLIPRLNHSTNKGQYIVVNWADGHESKYCVEWLHHIDNHYGQTSSQVPIVLGDNTFTLPNDSFYYCSDNKVDTSLWNVKEIKSNLEPVDYNDLTDGYVTSPNYDVKYINSVNVLEQSQKRLEALYLLSKQLVTYGLTKIINVPQDRNQVLQVVRSIAYERPTGYGVVFDVTVEPSENINLAYSSLDFDLHTDLPYRESSPGVQLLHCIRNSSVGGLSFFADAFNAASILQESHPKLFNVLVNHPANFLIRDPYRDLHFRTQKPTINRDIEGKLTEVYYSPFTLPPLGSREEIKLYYLAMNRFTQILHSKDNKLVDKMEPGDLYIFHNRRILHGRSGYDPIFPRFLQGCYMDWDEISALYEKLHSHVKREIK